MLEIITPFGNFGKFQHLLSYMNKEGITSVQVTVNYIFDKYYQGKLSVNDLEHIIND